MTLGKGGTTNFLEYLYLSYYNVGQARTLLPFLPKRARRCNPLSHPWSVLCNLPGQPTHFSCNLHSFLFLGVSKLVF
jgi:hypothetical protein